MLLFIEMINDYLVYFLLYVFGTIFGSFLNLVSDRVVKGESILLGRSHCDYCKKELSVKNLVPLISFIIQKARAACCNKKLSWLYPISELLTGAAFIFAGNYSGVVRDFNFVNLLVAVYLVTVLCFFIILFLTDIKYRLIPDSVVYAAILVTFFLIILLSFLDLKIYYDKLNSDTLGPYLIQAGIWKAHLTLVFRRLLLMLSSSLFIALFFISLILVTKGRGMGGGDVKLGFLIGIFNGFPGNVLAVFLGFLLGSIYSVVLIFLKKKGIKDTIAFGPFLILGSVIAFIWGEAIINWYIGIF